MRAKAQSPGGLHVYEKADGADLRMNVGVGGGQSYIESFLFLDGGHCFPGSVIQVFCCCDGQAALRQNPLGLVDVGP